MYILLLLSLAHGNALADEAYEFSSISQAFEASRNGRLPAWPAEYVARAAGLPWEAERPRHDSGKDIRGYVSPNYEYCILSFAHFGEWGQLGEAEYCLIDRIGTIYWQKTTTIISKPSVSNRGLGALFTKSGCSTTDNRRIDLLIIGLEGDTLLNHTVEHLIKQRSFQRLQLSERYGFSNDGLLFCSSFNVESDNPPMVNGQAEEYYQNQSIFVYDAESNAHYMYDLGFFNAQLISNIRSSDIIIHGHWQLSCNPATYESGLVILKARGSRIEKIVISTPSMFEKGIY